MGDTAGHNDICGHIQKRCRSDKVADGKLNSVDPDDFDPLTCKDVVNCQGKVSKLTALGLRPHLYNVFFSLPFADRHRGVFGSTPFERLHVFNQGIFKHIVQSFHDIIGEKDAGKKDKAYYNNHFRAIASFVDRQSERDVVHRHSGRYDFTDNTNRTAMEIMGDLVIHVISLYTSDVVLRMSHIFDVYKKKNPTNGPAPCVSGCREAVEWILCYSKWIQDYNPAGEVLACRKRVGEVLQGVQQRYPRREGTEGWNIPKMRGAYLMGVDQIHRLGFGDGYDTQHGEKMHRDYITLAAKNTQRRPSVFVKQLALRRYENFTMESAISSVSDQLMQLPKPRQHKENDGAASTDLSTQTSSNSREVVWNYYDSNIPRNNDCVSHCGQYKVRVSEIDTKIQRGNSKRTYSIEWTNRDRNIIQTKLDDKLFFPISAHANHEGRWLKEFSFTGWTEITKKDITHGDHPTIYRAHPDYKTRPWFDWGLFHFDAQHPNTLCAGLIYGFVRFDTPGFPTPLLQEKWGTNIPDDSSDPTIYVVVRCAETYQNFDKRFITKVKLIKSEHSMYILPLRDLVGPLACVENIWNQFNDDDVTWLAILPYRKWGRLFGQSIKWQTN